MYALTAWLDVYPLRDCLLPPFTSKVTRTAFRALTGVEPSLRRRASFSVLFRDGKPLFRAWGERGSAPLSAREGERLTARISLLTDKPPEPPSSSAVFRFGAAELAARVSQVEVVDVRELSIDLPRKFVVRYLTPTLLPVPGRGELLKALGVKRRYRLLPDLPLALALLAHDLRLLGVEEVSGTFTEIYRWGLRALAELDYQVRPVTVLYSVKDGIPVTERGFTGFVAYELLDHASPTARLAKRLLSFAARFGVGKSRSIGFGHVEISPLR